ncbi:protein kinase [Streptomyces ovatisporus]|uniref:Protein kinase n=1 Tax=Streptomyces ovatisporus TaxID=1128682 RepID=A0ABV9A143_9ACTN
MEDYAGKAGRLLADRYRLPQPPADAYYLAESVAYDTASGQEVLVRQIPLPEVVDAEFVGDGVPGGAAGEGRFRGSVGRATRRPADPAVRRAVEAAVAAARIPDHPRLDQVFDVFVEGDGLWIVSELLPATPLASLLQDQTLTAHRAAEIAADVLTALRTVHAHGWTHRNVTARTVLICDDGRALLTGLAVGAAEEALCGYNPLPDAGPAPLPPTGAIPGDPSLRGQDDADGASSPGGAPGPSRGVWTDTPLPEGFDARQEDEPYGGDHASPGGAPPPAPESPRWEEPQSPRGIFGLQGPAPGGADPSTEPPGPPARGGYERGTRGPRSSAIAAYQAGTRRAAAARAGDAERGHDEEHVHGADGAGQGRGPYGAHPAPDDCVRWLPAGEDEVSPSDLPGSRPPNSLPVRASWRSDTASAHPGQERGDAGCAEDGAYADEFTGDLVPYDAEDDAYPAEPDEENPAWGLSGEDDGGEHFRGPTSALAAERARHARMTVVGAVSERWAPEQAGPVYENWRLAPPVGPAADLWALGVLLFRAVQGHAPYPEDDVAELVQMVCAEPPAFAEDCGPLRPVVESLMRQDPTERPDFEELRGWLRSLVRSAPEPDAGWHTVYAPSLETGGPSDPRRLPILRRRGELVRRRRAERRAAAAERKRQKRSRPKRTRSVPPTATPPTAPPPTAPADPPGTAAPPAPPAPPASFAATAPPPPHAAAPPVRERSRRVREKKSGRAGGSPLKLGRLLLGLVLLGLTGAVLYAMWFMPKDGTDGASNQQRGSVGGESRPPQPGDDGAGQGDSGQGDGGRSEGAGKGGADKPQNPGPGGKVPEGYKLSRDPAGFQIAVPREWDRRSTTGRGQVRYNGGPVEMVVVNGRDSTKKYGDDPMAYQSDDEPELAAYRASEWASTTGLRRIDVGATAMAEGTFSWRDGGRDVYARNRAMILDGRYHLLLVMGSKSNKAEIDRHFEAVADTYRATRR